MLDWAVRYLPIAEWLDDVGARHVLDVGSGDHGLSRYWSGGIVVQTDLGPMTSADGMRVRARAEALPFVDGAFDAVVSLDLLEHLSPEVRESVIRELARVSLRYLAVGCPVAPHAPPADTRLLRTLRLMRLTPPAWLTEHLEHDYPTQGEVASLLSVVATVRREETNDPVRSHNLTALCGLVPGLHVLPKILDRRAARCINRRPPRAGYRHLWLAERP